MYPDDYQQRIGRLDERLHQARQEFERAGGHHTIAPGRDESADIAEWAASLRVSPQELAVIHAQRDRERAMQAWEREMDEAPDLYGLIPVQGNEPAVQHDNVIAVDFANRARVSRTHSPRGGR